MRSLSEMMRAHICLSTLPLFERCCLGNFFGVFKLMTGCLSATGTCPLNGSFWEVPFFLLLSLSELDLNNEEFLLLADDEEEDDDNDEDDDEDGRWDCCQPSLQRCFGGFFLQGRAVIQRSEVTIIVSRNQEPPIHMGSTPSRLHQRNFQAGSHATYLAVLRFEYKYVLVGVVECCG